MGGFSTAIFEAAKYLVMNKFMRSSCDPAWRAEIRKPRAIFICYQLSSFLYWLPGLTYLAFQREIPRKIPILEGILSEVMPWFLILQGLLSYWGDCINLGRSSFAHFIDTIFASWGSYCYFYVLAFEHLNPIQYALGTMGLAHASYSFYMSRLYRSARHKHLESYCLWHISWHVALPFWVLCFGAYTLAAQPDAPKHQWYPPVLSSFIVPYTLLLSSIWITRLLAQAPQAQPYPNTSSKDVALHPGASVKAQ
mmetsp:Transcript_140009/g.390283  ORF Transcript_140009/g.390283 Transcript_140009/m.390283 type:complete len:252 (-) Transcript_140009:52-807(-)